MQKKRLFLNWCDYILALPRVTSHVGYMTLRSQHTWNFFGRVGLYFDSSPRDITCWLRDSELTCKVAKTHGIFFLTCGTIFRLVWQHMLATWLCAHVQSHVANTHTHTRSLFFLFCVKKKNSHAKKETHVQSHVANTRIHTYSSMCECACALFWCVWVCVCPKKRRLTCKVT